VIAAGLGVLSILAAKWALSRLLVNDPVYLEFLQQSMPVRFCIAFLLMGCVTMLSWIWYTLKDQKEQDKRKAVNEQLSKEAELYNLRQQLKPHFLFNSLNSISALAITNSEEARNRIPVSPAGYARLKIVLGL
jgi:two-component system LytT family sensor kinase